MTMGKGGGGEIKETWDQKSAAMVAKKQWAIYQRMFVPQENAAIGRAVAGNDPGNYSAATSGAVLGQSVGLTNQTQQINDALFAAGADPTSGRYQMAQSGLTAGATRGGSEGASRGQFETQTAYLQDLNAISAMGAGRSAEAGAGYADIAAGSAQAAADRASAASSRRTGNQAAVSSALGLGAGYAANKWG